MSRISAIVNGQAIESFRSSDFNIPSAIGELIDNSIQANAKHIHVSIETQNHETPESRKIRKLIQEITCIDDGSGMSGGVDGVLHKCICLGYSSRYNDRNGIGRFGVGMTFAGIRFATKLEVYSKVRGGKWEYVKYDLKDEEDIKEGIAEPVQKTPPEKYLKQVTAEHGTIVIWSNFDKPLEHDMYASTYDDIETFNGMRKSKYGAIKMEPTDSLNPFGLMNIWLGRTFRKFIWEGVELTLNGNSVYAFDPLYLNKEKNQFPEDKPATLLEEGDIPWEDKYGNKHNIHYIFTITPEQYRGEDNTGGYPFPGRYIYENHGISIMRANREVLYDVIPRLQKSNTEKIAWDELDRWWSCELSFDPALDDSFSVKNIKRGAIPVKELNEVLYETLKNLRKTARNRVKDYWNKTADEKDKAVGDNPHRGAEETAKKALIGGKCVGGPVGNPDKEQEHLDDLLSDEIDQAERLKMEALFKSQPFTIRDERWKGDQFLDPTLLNGSAVLQYNLNHPFMKELAQLRENIGDNGTAKYLTDLIDIIFMSVVKARQNQTDEAEVIVDEFWDQLVADWGRFLKTYTRTYQETHPYMQGDE